MYSYQPGMHYCSTYGILYSVLDKFDSVKIIYRPVSETTTYLSKAIGMWNLIKRRSSFLPNFMGRTLSEEVCVFNLNYLGMKFFQLFQSFDSLPDKVINIWISIFLNKRIKNLSYYGIGGLIDNIFKK